MPKNEKHVVFNAFRLICLKNAEDALKASELLLGKNLNHIAYHLCLLSLEEIGKIFMSWMKLNQVESWDKETTNAALDDHVKKLFYAIWGPSIGVEIINKEQILDNQHMASTLHALRLFYLYGDIKDTVESSRKIKDEEVQSIYRFAHSRLQLASIEGEVNEEVEINRTRESTWIEQFMELPGKRKYVFAKESQEKLIELGDVNAWIKWLKETHEAETRELDELAEKEMNRPISIENDKINTRWEITFTINSPSHSIRNKDINTVNKFDRPFKLYPGKDRHTLVIKNMLSSIVGVNDLWDQGWYTSKLFVAALNVATLGLFYWQIPKDIDRFYDSIWDLESKKKGSRLLCIQNWN